MTQTQVEWRRRFPLLLALLFCVYAASLIHDSLDARRRLRETEIVRVIEQNSRLAAALDDDLAAQEHFVADLTAGPEIKNFLTNRALGMSLQYGLQASRDAIETRFRRIQSDRRVAGRPLFTRFAYLDETGARMVDTGTGEIPRVPPGLSVNAATGTALIAVQTAARDGNAGLVLAWADLGGLLGFLLPHPQGPLDRTLVLTRNGEEVSVFPGMAPLSESLNRQIAAMIPGKGSVIADPAGGGQLIATTESARQAPLSVVTLRRFDGLKEAGGDNTFLVIASLLPLAVVAASLLSGRMQRRHDRMELALKSSRQRLLSISENLVEGIALIDGGDTVLFVNRAALTMLGIEGDATALVGGPLEALLRLDRPLWRAVIADGQPCLVNDTYLESPTGARINAALSCTPLVDPESGPAAILAFRDIKAIKQAQQQAMQTARLVSIGQLAAGIAHEINTPAQYIGSNLSYLHDEAGKLMELVRIGRELDADGRRFGAVMVADEIDFLMEEMPKAIAESRDGVEQISHIVRSMKEFSHPGETNHAAADLNQTIETSLTVSRSSWKYALEIERDFQPCLPPVACNIGEINQVFLNLIINAAQALEDRGGPLPGRLRISTRSDGDCVEIRFQDNGPGVSRDIQDRIFDPFFTTKPVGKGTGQGLAICRNIVTVHHDGSLEVESAENQGATFIVRLPCGRAGQKQ